MHYLLATQSEAQNNSAVWTLVGVIVGAIIGGVAQVAAGVLRARHEKERELREERRRAYQAFLGAAWQIHGAKLHMAVGGIASSESSDEFLARASAFVDRLVKASLATDIAIGGVQLVGPKDVADKAREIERHFFDRSKARGDDTEEDDSDEDEHRELRRLIDEFVSLAQPHAGIVKFKGGEMSA